jgi:hypothetical protein
MRVHIALFALVSVCTEAPGFAARSDPAGLTITGTISAGETPNDFTQIVDLRTGFAKHVEQMGPSTRQYGFNGQPWSAASGILSVSNLPSAVAREATFAWIDRQAWRERMAGDRRTRRVVPPGGNPVALEFDPRSRLPRQATVDGDWGPIVIKFSDWRRIGRLLYPFHREQVEAAGERTTIKVRSARLAATLSRRSLAPPDIRSHAEPLPNGTASIPFQALGAKQSHIQVDSLINGQPAKLIFDTGAANYLTTEAAPAFGVKATGGVNIGGVGESSSTGGYATIDRIALGAAALRNQTFVVGPAPWPPAKDAAAGLTGYEFFAEYVTTIDYPNRRIRFSTSLPNPRGGRRVPFYNDDSHIYVKATIDGVEGLFGLDTGDGGTVAVFPAFAERFHIRGASGEATASGGGIGGSVKSQPGVLERFSLGGLNFDALPVRFPQNRSGAFASKSIAGNLGGGVLQCFSITIDFPRHALLFEPAPDNPHCRPGGTVRRS